MCKYYCQGLPLMLSRAPEFVAVCDGAAKIRNSEDERRAVERLSAKCAKGDTINPLRMQTEGVLQFGANDDGLFDLRNRRSRAAKFFWPRGDASGAP
jgi:hypothetical protein